MNILRIIIYLTLFLAGSANSAGNNSEKAKCHWKFQIEGSDSKKKCFPEHLLEEKIYSERKLIDLVKNANCYAIAISNDSKCKAVGFSDALDQFCWSDKTMEFQQTNALVNCKKNGCSCELVVSNHRIINENLFFSWSNKNYGLTNPEERVKLSSSKDVQNVVEEKSIREKPIPPEINKHTDSRLRLRVTTTSPTIYGDYTILIETDADMASLKINGEELGGKADGRYTINRIARAGQETKIEIIGKDVFGNTDSKIITVSRAAVDSKVVYAALDPAKIKRQVERDAVAIIIGVSDYRNLPKALHADDDARAFYDYAIRALGVKPENIKLLVDQDAEDIEIIKTFKTWLPSRVRLTTDVYVYYSGHGLPTQDGQGLYLLPPRADRDLISRTAIQFQEINADLQAAKPKSVTIFMDACYSGQARSGETLVANARPVTLKAEKKLFPDNFTVITASQADQISSSSPDLKHGIFSYYLMKGMEGDADTNKDGKITLGEMQAYLVENVGAKLG